MELTRDEILALRDGATPGPWSADVMPNVWSQSPGRHGKVAELCDRRQASHYDVIPENENVANARFIAAAPDLADTAIAALDREAKLIAERDALRAQLAIARADSLEARLEAMSRRNMSAPEDPHVEALCLRYGYGAVMDAASRLWTRQDSLGAFYIGGCVGFRSDDEALRAEAKEASE